MSQSLSTRLIGGRGFDKEGEGNRTESKKGVAKFSTCRPARSALIRQVTVLCASSCLVIRLHSVLAPQLKVSKSSGAGMPEGWSLCFSKLLPRILIQTRCSSTSYILVRARTYRHKVKRMVGWVTIPHCYSFPPLLHEDIILGNLSRYLVFKPFELNEIT